MFEGHAVAVGPVGAIDLALREAVSSKYSFIKAIKLIDYKVRVLNGDKATGAKVRVLVESSNSKETWGTIGVSENIIEASYAALFDSYSYVFNNQKILSETNALLT
jgi:2-isopropylmalate synthase